MEPIEVDVAQDNIAQPGGADLILANEVQEPVETEADATIEVDGSAGTAEAESDPNYVFIAIAIPFGILLVVGIVGSMLWVSFNVIFKALMPNPEAQHEASPEAS